MGKKIEVHALARRLPPMPYEDYEALREDIRVHGQHLPIVKWRGKIIDGAHRLKACQELGITPLIIAWHGKEADLPAYVRGVNIPRRHLTVSQKAVYGVREMLGAERKRVKEREKARKLRQKNRTSAETQESLEAGEESLGAAAVVAKELGIGARTIYIAQAVQEADKALADEVFKGELSLTKAQKKLKAAEEGTQAVKDLGDPAVIKEKAEEGHRLDKQFADLLKREVLADTDWKIVVEGQLDDEAYLRLGTRVRWCWEGIE